MSEEEKDRLERLPPILTGLLSIRASWLGVSPYYLLHDPSSIHASDKSDDGQIGLHVQSAKHCEKNPPTATESSKQVQSKAFPLSISQYQRRQAISCKVGSICTQFEQTRDIHSTAGMQGKALIPMARLLPHTPLAFSYLVAMANRTHDAANGPLRLASSPRLHHSTPSAAPPHVPEALPTHASSLRLVALPPCRLYTTDVAPSGVGIILVVTVVQMQDDNPRHHLEARKAARAGSRRATQILGTIPKVA
ncbi:uncharacterized protein CLUP02_01562 [Colletotrichum lupini]|uniref:Uncharacterized protein n=1 Tax=Colletotrichum lupini TaxID=145971 RepID=A0A9Q8SCX5_9PEZI|nr:uncharacterized protein CLUP02_01562 [Colletotrichum lupini]UQC74910.1 hypothetical protein CLUP02_01562 [Colletotrichum lupini]